MSEPFSKEDIEAGLLGVSVADDVGSDGERLMVFDMEDDFAERLEAFALEHGCESLEAFLYQAIMTLINGN